MQLLQMCTPRPFHFPLLPSNPSVTIRCYRNEDDVAQWLRLCSAGALIGQDNGRAAFVNDILQCPHTDFRQDLLFLEQDGNTVGTVHIAFRESERIGDIRMLTAEKGRGFGRILLLGAMEELKRRGAEAICAKVSPEQLDAIRLFLWAGFLPVSTDNTIEEDWIDLLPALESDELTMLNPDGEFYRTLYSRSNMCRQKLRIGVFGIDRGAHFMRYCLSSPQVELVALCDRYEPTITRVFQELDLEGIPLFENFDDFIRQDMDAVILSNYATEHAPYAIRCLERGLHVLSEVMVASTVEEATELIDAVERSGKVYAYGENFCFMPATRTMRKLFRRGMLGKFEYGEGEYVHNIEPIHWDIIQHNLNHWRLQIDGFFYCSHSMGPLVHISGLRPKKVSGFALPPNEKSRRLKCKAVPLVIEVVTMENGTLCKSLHGGATSRCSNWFTVYGTRGRAESAREDAGNDGTNTLYLSCDKDTTIETEAVLFPTSDRLSAEAEKAGHGGSDFYVIHNFVQKVLGDRNADTLDVYEAVDIFLVGRFAKRSAEQGGLSLEIPDFRDKKIREQYRQASFITT